jgi:hypothetical protein
VKDDEKDKEADREGPEQLRQPLLKNSEVTQEQAIGRRLHNRSLRSRSSKSKAASRQHRVHRLAYSSAPVQREEAKDVRLHVTDLGMVAEPRSRTGLVTGNSDISGAWDSNSSKISRISGISGISGAWNSSSSKHSRISRLSTSTRAHSFDGTVDPGVNFGAADLDAEDLDADAGSRSASRRYASFQAGFRRSKAITTLLLLTYSIITEGTMALLRCVEVQGLPPRLSLRLMLAAQEVICWTPWQQLLIAVLVLILAPFPLVLLIWVQAKRRKLRRLRDTGMSGSGEKAGFATDSAANGDGIGAATRRVEASDELLWLGGRQLGTELAVAKVLEGPFKSSPSLARNWELVILARRFVLLACFTFVRDNYWRDVALTACCVTILVLHLLVTPFRERKDQQLETASLSMLVLLAVLGFGESVAAVLGDDFSDTAVDTLQLLLLVLPLCAALAVVVVRLAHKAGARAGVSWLIDTKMSCSCSWGSAEFEQQVHDIWHKQQHEHDGVHMDSDTVSVGSAERERQRQRVTRLEAERTRLTRQLLDKDVEHERLRIFVTELQASIEGQASE